MTRFVLLRHGEHRRSGERRLLGLEDAGLSERGRDQAELLARVLAAVDVAAVYSSPARRAVETAAAIAREQGLQPTLEPALREIDFGRVEGLTYEQVEAADPELFRSLMQSPALAHFPGGEDERALRARSVALLECLLARHRGETVVLVAHAGPLRTLLSHCLAMPAEAAFRLDQRYGAASVVEWLASTPVVRSLNVDPPGLGAALTDAEPDGGEQEAADAGATRLERPALPEGFDDSRASERRRRPEGWRFDPGERAAVWRAVSERRDIRRFRSIPLSDVQLRLLLEAAHRAPSVGMMQPWRFVVVRDAATKAAMQALAARERLVQARHFDDRARAYLDLKLEGIREAPLSICVCCDRGATGDEVLGRHTIRDTDLYSTCLAIENLWLVARAEGIGVGWVSFYRPEDVSRLLELPEHVVPVAWLCLGYPDERPSRPGLETAGWQARRPLDALVHAERWQGAPAHVPSPPVAAGDDTSSFPPPPLWWRRLAGALVPGDMASAQRVRDDSDELVKPAGSLGALELVVERWAMATGSPPPASPRAGILVCVADHGVSERAVSLYPGRVGAQVAAAAARGETAIGVLARRLGAELVVADIGLSGPRLPGLVDRRVAGGSADITVGPAMSEAELRSAVEAGQELACKLAARCDIVVLGEIGIGNTTSAAALLAALTRRDAAEVCGRGTGLDSRGLEQKRAVVAAALAANAPQPADALDCLRRLGGLELAALVGALLGAACARRPVLLDGFATSVAALVASRMEPALRDYLIAGHLSAEPAHRLVLTELGLEPMLDLRMRLGEASGAALALPLLGLAASLHGEMSRFAEAGVERGADSVAAAGPSARPRDRP